MTLYAMMMLTGANFYIGFWSLFIILCIATGLYSASVFWVDKAVREKITTGEKWGGTLFVYGLMISAVGLVVAFYSKDLGILFPIGLFLCFIAGTMLKYIEKKKGS